MTDGELRPIEDLLLGGPNRFTPGEVRDAAGTDEAWSQRLWRAIGFPEVPPGTAAFTQADVDALRRVVALRDSGLPEDELVNITRIASLAMARVADAVTAESAIWSSVAPRAADGSITAAQLPTAALAELDALLVYLSHRQLLAAALWRMATTPEVDEWPQLAVAFADIVGFTELSQQLPGDEISELIERFEAITGDVVAEGGGRTVKTIGDAVLFTAETAAAAGAIAIELSAAMQPGNDDNLPGVRIGIAAGPVLARFGDVYGPVVNLASRLVAAARPGSILVGATVAEQIAGDERFHTRSLRPRRLKGLGRTAYHVLTSSSSISPSRA